MELKNGLKFDSKGYVSRRVITLSLTMTSYVIKKGDFREPCPHDGKYLKPPEKKVRRDDLLFILEIIFVLFRQRIRSP